MIIRKMIKKANLSRLITPLCMLFCTYYFIAMPIEQIYKLFYQQGFSLCDFAVYYKAGVKALQHHTVYDVTDHWQFKYSPLIAYLFGISFSKINFFYSQILFTILIAVSWPYLIIKIIQAYSPHIRNNLPATLRSVALIFLFLGNSFLLELRFGQVNIIPYALIFCFFMLYSKISHGESRGKHYFKLLALSALWSLAFQFKLYAGIIGAYLLFKKEFKLIALTVLITVLLDFAFLGQIHGWQFTLQENFDWLKTLAHSSAVILNAPGNSGLRGLIARIPGLEPLYGPVWMTGLAIFLGFQYLLRKRPPLTQLALNLSGVLVLTPLVWNYWNLLAIPTLLMIFEQNRPFSMNSSSSAKWVFALLFLNNLLSFNFFSRCYLNPITQLLIAIWWLRIQTQDLDLNLSHFNSTKHQIQN